MENENIHSLYNKILDEQINHFRKTKDTEVAERGRKTIKEYLNYIKKERDSLKGTPSEIYLDSFGDFEEHLRKLEKKLLSCFE